MYSNSFWNEANSRSLIKDRHLFMGQKFYIRRVQQILLRKRTAFWILSVKCMLYTGKILSKTSIFKLLVPRGERRLILASGCKQVRCYLSQSTKRSKALSRWIRVDLLEGNIITVPLGALCGMWFFSGYNLVLRFGCFSRSEKKKNLFLKIYCTDTYTILLVPHDLFKTFKFKTSLSFRNTTVAKTYVTLQVKVLKRLQLKRIFLRKLSATPGQDVIVIEGTLTAMFYTLTCCFFCRLPCSVINRKRKMWQFQLNDSFS